MMDKLESMKRQLSELATVLNEFKSETVQLRILDLLLDKDAPGDDAEEPERRVPASKVRQKSKAKGGGVLPSAKRKKAPSGTGAPATLTQLLSGNFFDQTRTINDVIEHCRHNLARTFKANEFSGKLGRMVRNGELIRKKNADNQYEYKKP